MIMKKKLGCLAIAALLSASTISAFAAELNVPVPADNLQAYDIAENLVKKGLYYEAYRELEYCNPNADYYDAAKIQAWKGQINQKIIRYELDCELNAIKAAYKANDPKAMNDAIYVFDQDKRKYEKDYYALRDWKNKLEILMAKDVVKTANASINAVKSYGYTLRTNDERYMPVNVNPFEYHVYIQTKTPTGAYKDVAAFVVNKHTGAVSRSF